MIRRFQGKPQLKERCQHDLDQPQEAEAMFWQPANSHNIRRDSFTLLSKLVD